MQILTEIIATPKTGDETLMFKGEKTNYTLLDFWQWSVSDILSNAIRGKFAEFIVGSVIELNTNNLRSEWSAFDLISKEGIKIEVKSASYIQSWQQTKYSDIRFSIKPTQHFENQGDIQRTFAKRQADVYVFCLLKHKEQDTINPLNLEQWSFYVLATVEIDKKRGNKSSISLKSLQGMADEVEYDKLKEKIYEVYKAINIKLIT